MSSGERRENFNQQSQQSNFSNNYESYQKQSSSQTNLSSNNPTVVAVQAPSTYQRLNSSSMNNFSSNETSHNQNYSAPRQRLPSSGGGGPGFSVTPDQLARTKMVIKDEPKDMLDLLVSIIF
jgi:hypothetical protein